MTYYKKIREEVRPCVSCNENHLIYDRNKWLCKDCYNKKKQEKLNRKTLETRKNDLNDVFEKIWSSRPHYCFHCGKYLGSEPKAIYFSHILSRGAHPALRCDEENVVRKEQRDRLEWLRVWGDECVFMEENPDQIRHNADKLYLNVKKMMVYMMEATKEMCLRIDHMENLQGRSFADDILPGYQSEEELEALEEQRQKEQRKSFWSSLFGKKEK